MRALKLCLLVVILSSPFHLALASVPEQAIFTYTGDGELTFFNTHTDELIKTLYKDGKGDYLERGVRDIDYALRCRLTNQETKMDIKLIELVDHIQDHFGAREIDVISGYRSPKLNGLLISSGRGVAGRSYHLKGMAIDMRIPGVPTKEVRNYAMALKAGGVGYYPGPDFVHVDVGPVRYW